MKLALLLVALLVVAIAALPLLRAVLARGRTDGQWPFFVKKPLSSPEQVLYFRLVAALPGHIVLAQVQLSRFLGVTKGNDFHKWNNRINRQSVDFLVCAKDSAVIAAIELDDSSHTRPDRIRADAKKDKALGDAGVRIVRWHVKTMPDHDTIRAVVLQPDPATPSPATDTASGMAPAHALKK